MVLTGATGASLLDVTIPAGAYDVLTGTGWKSNAANTTWSFRAPGSSTQGIQKVRIKLNPAVPGGVKIAVKGRNGAYAAIASDAPVIATLVLDEPTAPNGQCVNMMFSSCSLSPEGATLRCK